MTQYTIHTPDTAPEAAGPILAGIEQNTGFIPNIFGVMAAAPPVLEAFTTLVGLMDKMSLSGVEKQVILLAVSVVNTCHYCVAAHSTMAAGQGVPADVIEAIRNGTPIADAKLEALRQYAAVVVETRGHPPQATQQAFENAGYTKEQALEVILGASIKTLANYVNSTADTPVDPQFASQAWDGQAQAA